MTHFSLPLLLAATAAAPGIVVAQLPSCPAGDLVSALSPPLDSTCVLCVPVDASGEAQCGASCACSDSACSNPVCTVNPDGCGVVKCLGDPTASTPAPVPAPPTTTTTTTTTTTVAPPPATNPVCGIEVTVGCVLWDDPTVECAEYVPTTDAECSALVKYEYYAKAVAPPAGSVLTSITRYRDGSYHGNPKKYNEPMWNTTLMTGWYMTAAEGEYVDFCEPAESVAEKTTTFEFKHDGGSLGTECTESVMYTPRSVGADVTGQDEPCDLCGGRGGEDVVATQMRDLGFVPAFANNPSLFKVQNCADLLAGVEDVVDLLAGREVATGLLGMEDAPTHGESCAAVQSLGVYCGCAPHDPPCGGVCPNEGEVLANPGDTVDGGTTDLERIMNFPPTCEFYAEEVLPTLGAGTERCGEAVDAAVVGGGCACVAAPTAAPSSAAPTSAPSSAPSSSPTVSMMPSSAPTAAPSAPPTVSHAPSGAPTAAPSAPPTVSRAPSGTPTAKPTTSPTNKPTDPPTIPCRVEPEMNCTAPGGVDCNDYDYDGTGTGLITVEYYYVPKNVGSEPVTLTELTTVRHGMAEDLLLDLSEDMLSLDPGESIMLVRMEDVDVKLVSTLYEATLSIKAEYFPYGPTGGSGSCGSQATERSVMP